MRVFLFLAVLAMPAVASAQSIGDDATQAGSGGGNLPRMADNLEPAPVPSVAPRSGNGAASDVPERIAPPGVGNNIAGPADATPFSSTPSANMPSGPNATRGGGGATVPNTSK